MSVASGTVYIVDDDAGVRESIEALLQASGFDTAGFASGTGFLDAFDPVVALCVLLDVRMPEIDGLAVLDRLNAEGRNIPVIMVTAHGDIPMAVRAMQAGAVDFIEKPYEPERLIGGIENAISGCATDVSVAVPEFKVRFEKLTPRETEVMLQMVIGHPNKIIAYNLDLSERTVEVHRGRVMQKTGAESLSHLVRMALKAGFDPDR